VTDHHGQVVAAPVEAAALLILTARTTTS